MAQFPLWVGALGSSPTEVYSMGDIASLVAMDDTDLENAFSAQNYTDVETDNSVRVTQEAFDPEYAVFLFKDTNSSQQNFTVEWNGQSSRAPSEAAMYLEVLNRSSGLWESLDSNNVAAADVDFTLTGGKSSSLGDYFDASFIIVCRVQQSAA